MNIEQEARFYFSHTKRDELITAIKKQYKYSHSYHEVTTMYDNPNPELSFYTPEVDGRLRVRYSKQSEDAKLGEQQTKNQEECLVTWKRRLGNDQGDGVRREEEIEFSVNADESDSVIGILEKVLQCQRVSSYERIRHFFEGDSLQITLDEFPFGLMLEFELKDSQDDDILKKAVEAFGLYLNNSSSLSCDDKYQELCEENNVEPVSDITFSDSTMPVIG